MYFSPLRLITVCKILKVIIHRDFGKTGIYNLGSKNGLSKLFFTLLFLKYLKIKNNNFKIACVNDILKIKRSKNMLMNIDKFKNAFKVKLPNLKDEIKNEVRENYLK